MHWGYYINMKNVVWLSGKALWFHHKMCEKYKHNNYISLVTNISLLTYFPSVLHVEFGVEKAKLEFSHINHKTAGKMYWT